MSLTRILLIALVALVLGASSVHAQVQEAWSHVYPGPGDNDEEAAGIGLDALGNCYVAGNSYGSITGDFLVGKYNASGGMVWQNPINGPGDSSDFASAMLVDANGNTFVSGWTKTRGVWWEGKLLVKVTPGGNMDWAHAHAAGSSGSVRHLAFDSSGNILAAGMGSSSGYHAYAMKYSPAGDSLWTRFYRWPGSSGGNAQRVACSPDGSVYIAGTVVKSTGTVDDILTVRLSADGDTLWGRVYDGPLHRYDEGVDLAVDGDGNAYVVGKTKDSSGNPEIVVLKYGAGGTLLWDWNYKGSSNLAAEPIGVRLDPAGNVCVGGSSSEIAKSRDFVFIKLSPAGDSLLVAFAGTDAWEDACALALDAIGNMYITGTRPGVSSHAYLTMKFDGATGAKDWEMTWGGAAGYNRSTHICVGQEDHVYVAGYVDPAGEPDTKRDIGVVAYEPVAAAVFEPATNEPPRGFALYQNSPNPFNAGTTIRFDLETGGSATLSIVNILGQTILSHRQNDLPSGTFSFEWDGADSRGVPAPSGVYLYRLQTDRHALSRKMVLLK